MIERMYDWAKQHPELAVLGAYVAIATASVTGYCLVNAAKQERPPAEQKSPAPNNLARIVGEGSVILDINGEQTKELKVNEEEIEDAHVDIEGLVENALKNHQCPYGAKGFAPDNSAPHK